VNFIPAKLFPRNVLYALTQNHFGPVHFWVSLQLSPNPLISLVEYLHRFCMEHCTTYFLGHCMPYPYLHPHSDRISFWWAETSTECLFVSYCALSFLSFIHSKTNSVHRSCWLGDSKSIRPEKCPDPALLKVNLTWPDLE